MHSTDLSMYVTDGSSRNKIVNAESLPTTYARDELPTLERNGVRYHSAVSPQSEAEELPDLVVSELGRALQSTTAVVQCVVLGPGLGYILQALERFLKREKCATTVEVTCVEHDSTIARKALELRVWEPVSFPVHWALSGDSAAEVAVHKVDIVIKSTTGYRTARDQYDALFHTAGTRQNRPQRLRILVPTPLYGGSYPIAKYCASAFRELGHDVEVLDLAEYYPLFKHAERVTKVAAERTGLQQILTSYLAEVIVARAREQCVDLVWAVAQTPLTPVALRKLRDNNIASAFWFVEDYKVFPYWRAVATAYDAFLTIQRGTFAEELVAHGVAHHQYLPLAADPTVHSRKRLTPEEAKHFGSAVSFAGAGYHNRRETFSRLDVQDFKIWGSDWPSDGTFDRFLQDSGRRVDTEETVKIFSSCDVNLNLHSSNHVSGVNPHGDYVNPRTFELACCEAFQLVDARSELATLFEVGKEIVTFNNTAELPELIRYYLAHPEQRHAIAARARARVLREHTYLHRMQSALTFLYEHGCLKPSATRSDDYIEKLIDAAEGDPEMTEFLRQFEEEDHVTLDDTIRKIELSKHKLSRPEAVFLLMKEFRDWGIERGVIA